MERLDKYLANNAAMSRSEARQAVRDGIVTVNGVAVKSIGHKINADDTIFVLNQHIEVQGETYILLHKPEGVVCTTEEEEEQDTVIDCIPDYDDQGLHIAGRLDKDTTGVVLLSSDGKWTHMVTSPNYKSEKVYELETADPIAEEVVEQFREGILLKDSPKYTLPAKLEILSETKARLTLTEGRYHQVKRMFGACGNKVEKLHRSSVGSVNLEGLAEGEYRELSKEEVDSFLTKS